MSTDKPCMACETVWEYIRVESEAMLKYALGAGLKVPASLVKNLQTFTRVSPGQVEGEFLPPPDIKDLVPIHDRLARIVAPAKPRSILLMDQESRKKSIFKILGPVPFIRRMMGVAIFSLVLFVIISLSPQIDAKPEYWDPFQSWGWGLLMREIFLIAAASIGVSFISLFKANRFIVEGRFDPSYESAYWTRFILGIMAGFLLAMLIPIEESVQSDFGKPLLALLGGFSTDVVYNLLSRLVEALKSILSGGKQANAESHSQGFEKQMEEENVHNRYRMAFEIMKMQQDIDTSSSPEEIKGKLAQLSDSILANIESEKG